MSARRRRPARRRTPQAGCGKGISDTATTAAVGDCLVTTRWLSFHRVWQGSGEVFDTVDLFLPDAQLRTQARAPPGVRARGSVAAASRPGRRA